MPLFAVPGVCRRAGARLLLAPGEVQERIVRAFARVVKPAVISISAGVAANLVAYTRRLGAIRSSSTSIPYGTHKSSLRVPFFHGTCFHGRINWIQVPATLQKWKFVPSK